MVTLRLCYVDGQWAYFTSQDLVGQSGEDWNKSSYEANAKPPREYGPHDRGEPWQITKVAWDGPLETPSDYGSGGLSVDQINAGAAPWLAPDRCARQEEKHAASPIFAGVTLKAFRALIEAAGGQVYEEPQPLEISRLNVAPGEILVLSCPRRLTVEAAKRIRATVERNVPFGVRVMLLEEGSSFSVIGFDEGEGGSKSLETPCAETAVPSRVKKREIE